MPFKDELIISGYWATVISKTQVRGKERHSQEERVREWGTKSLQLQAEGRSREVKNITSKLGNQRY